MGFPVDVMTTCIMAANATLRGKMSMDHSRYYRQSGVPRRVTPVIFDAGLWITEILKL